MEIVSLGAPSTPARASSTRPSPPRRFLMDDSDSSLTRKRPRLDSGDRSYRSMSADELANNPSRNTLRHSPSTPARYVSTTQGETDRDALPSVSGTPSKVTINVRDPPPNNSLPLPTGSSEVADVIQEKSELPKSNRIEDPNEVDAASPDVISVSSSASRSPEIEVAEIEDMSEDPGETRWRSLGEATEIQRTLLQRFPFAASTHHPRQAIDAINMAFDKGKPQLPLRRSRIS